MRLPGGKNFCHPRTPYVQGAAGSYRDAALKSLVHALKFRLVRNAAQPLAELIVRFVARATIDLSDFVVMPIPLSCRRERRRGFNQSELIAGHVAKQFGLALDVKTLTRIRHVKPQSEMEDHADRKENIRGRFAIKNPEAVRDKKILLIDDGATSGATLFEASRALKGAGAGKIIALTAAKA